MLADQRLTSITSCADLGNPTMAEALTEFGTAWTTGLVVLTEVQEGTAQGLRKAVSDYLHTDVDAAAGLRAAIKGLEPL
ncbi:hypothetical protein [Nocardioides sp. KR10-350]|uniref:hypothetical protein n=1 Tax=Nocardioides cheoyonin TaxID=3156615 RepID=UPI0032B31B79